MKHAIHGSPLHRASDLRRWDNGAKQKTAPGGVSAPSSQGLADDWSVD